MAQVTQKGCGNSITGNTQELSGHGPGQAGGPTRAGVWMSRGLIQPQTVYNSVILPYTKGES